MKNNKTKRNLKKFTNKSYYTYLNNKLKKMRINYKKKDQDHKIFFLHLLNGFVGKRWGLMG